MNPLSDDGAPASIRDDPGVDRSCVKLAFDAQPTSTPGVDAQAAPGEPDENPLASAGLPVFCASRSLLSRYGVALAITAAALLACALLMPLFGQTAPPLVLLTLAVAATAWWGGLGPGLVSTAISTLVASWAFVPQHYSFFVRDPAEIVRLAFAAFSGVAISALAEAMHRAAGRQRLAIRYLAREVRERSRVEATLQEQAQLLDLSSEAVFAWALNGTIRYWNLGAERLYGFTRAEAVERVSHELLQTHVEGGSADFLAALQRDGHWSGELRHRAHDGREVVVESRMVRVTGPEAEGGAVVLESNRDITARRQAEEMRARLAAIVESSEDAILSKDLTGRIRSWNAGAQRMFGYSAEEAIGQSISLLVPPERREEEAETLQRLRRGERVEHRETVRVAEDGRRINVSVTVSPITDYAGQRPVDLILVAEVAERPNVAAGRVFLCSGTSRRRNSRPSREVSART